MHLPKVSILIPLYNSENYISETIESALSQSWENKEIIIVDDGSTDNSYQIAKTYESKIIKVYQQENQGACVARNLAFEKSTGDYIQYLDADDLMSPEKIEKQMAYFLKYGDEICTTSKTLHFKDNIAINKDTGIRVSRDYSNPLDYMVDTWEIGDYLGIHAWLIPRKKVKKAGVWDKELKRFQDGEFIIRVLFFIKEVKFVTDCEVYYRETPNGIGKGNNHAAVEKSSCIALTNVINKVIIPSNYDRAIKASIVNLSNSIYRWFPDFPNLVDSGFKTLRLLNVDIVLENENSIYKLLNFIFGWKTMRKFQIKYSHYRNKIRKLSNYIKIFKL